MVHLSDPRMASDAQSLIYYAQAIAQAVNQFANLPNDSTELPPVHAYFKEKLQTLRDIASALELQVG